MMMYEYGCVCVCFYMKYLNGLIRFDRRSTAMSFEQCSIKSATSATFLAKIEAHNINTNTTTKTTTIILL